MRLIAAAALLCAALAAPQDDIERKVAALLQELAGDDLEVADQAMRALVKLGQNALPTLKARHEKLSGDTKLKAEQVIRQIERGVRLNARMGDPARVTIKASDRPLAEVVEEFRRQTKQNVVLKDVPRDAKVSVALEDVPCWKALDDICRAHGQVMYRFSDTDVTVAPGRYRDCLKVVQDRFFVSIDRISFTIDTFPNPGATTSTSLRATVAWPAGTRPDEVTLDIAEFTDDKGTNLAEDLYPDQPAEASPDSARQVRSPFLFWGDKGPAEGAERLRLKGSVKLRYVLSTTRLMTIEAPAAGAKKAAPSGGSRLAIVDFARSGDRVDATFQVSSKTQYNLSNVVLRDAKGATIAARPRMEQHGATFTLEEPSDDPTYDIRCSFVVPEGVEIAALDLIEATDVEEFVVPFDFKDISLN